MPIPSDTLPAFVPTERSVEMARHYVTHFSNFLGDADFADNARTAWQVLCADLKVRRAAKSVTAHLRAMADLHEADAADGDWRGADYRRISTNVALQRALMAARAETETATETPRLS